MKSSHERAISPPVPSRPMLLLLAVLVAAAVGLVAVLHWSPVFAVVGIVLVIWGYFGVWVINVQGGYVTPAPAAERSATEAEFEQYVRQAAASPTIEIDRAKQLLDNGTITQAEFDKIKAKALG